MAYISEGLIWIYNLLLYIIQYVHKIMTAHKVGGKYLS